MKKVTKIILGPKVHTSNVKNIRKEFKPVVIAEPVVEHTHD